MKGRPGGRLLEYHRRFRGLSSRPIS
jgi:hypothetical protein